MDCKLHRQCQMVLSIARVRPVNQSLLEGRLVFATRKNGGLIERKLFTRLNSVAMSFLGLEKTCILVMIVR